MRIIITAVDSNPHYQDHMKAFLMSIRMNSPGIKIRVSLMDCSKEYADSLKKIYDAEIISHSTHGFKSAYQRNYIRHPMFLDAFKNKYDSVAWIDNDTLIRSALGEDFWKDSIGSNIKVWCRPGKNDKYKFQAGVYILGNTALTQGYVRDVLHQLQDKDNWMLPQTLVYSLHRKHYLSHIQMSEKYNDSKFKEKSTIWHCKQSHFKEKKFQKEFKYYLKKANIIIREKT